MTLTLLKTITVNSPISNCSHIGFMTENESLFGVGCDIGLKLFWIVHLKRNIKQNAIEGGLEDPKIGKTTISCDQFETYIQSP